MEKDSRTSLKGLTVELIPSVLYHCAATKAQLPLERNAG
jgi:hypothetical protein